MTWDFGRAEHLAPEAIGEPGQRTFRLQIQSEGKAASLWLEKEQLATLGLGLRQLLEQTSSAGTPTDADPVPPAETMPSKADIDFKIGKLGLGYDEEPGMVIIFAYNIEDVENSSPTFTCRASRRQCETFADQVEELVKAGRPLCILCDTPIDSDGHQCLRRNGHTDHSVSLE